MKDFKHIVVSKAMDADTIKYMSESDFLLMQKAINFLDISIEIFEQQNETINNIELALERTEYKLKAINLLLETIAKKED